MYIRLLSVANPLFRIVSCILITLLLAACGTSPSSPPLSATNTSVPTPISTKAFDIPGVLHIEGWFIGCDTQLVLSSDNFRYDSSDIQHMSAYLDAPDNASLPSTLKLMQVGVSTPSLLVGVAARCGGTLELTNIGNTPIQLSGFAIRLTADSQPNYNHYNLIDVCSIYGAHITDTASPYTCIPGAGGLGTWVSDFLFRPGKANTVFQSKIIYHGPLGTPGVENGDTNPTLDPGKPLDLVYQFHSPSSIGGQIYAAIPVLTLNTVGKQSTIELQQLADTFTFAKDNQFPCYKLQGDTFVIQKVSLGSNIRCM